MRSTFAKRVLAIAAFALLATGVPSAAQTGPAAAISSEKLVELKKQAVEGVEQRRKLAQVMNDKIFSFSELAFQEFETSKYITDILEKNGFTIERGVAGLPTAWVARWGSGSPVIGIGSDIDCLPKTSQKPGIAWREQLVEGAPGHGEGHNSGQALNVTAALALKDIMQRDKMPGTLMLWPGVAEELLAGKAFLVRAGVFKDVDAVLFTHVGSNLQTSWGDSNGTGMLSVEYSFHGETAHSALAPWRGKSALDAVELMDMGWNMRREHLRPEQRSHYVITNGGDQPNVVPSEASVWYFIRETDFANISKNTAIADKIADAAARMTDTTMTRRVIGTAAPRHFSKPIAEAMQANINQVGLPKWTEEENLFAKAVQKLVDGKQEGLATELRPLATQPAKLESGASDDIGDVSWTVPTVALYYPANIPNVSIHHWSAAMAMATPIAHKGIIAGAKVMAMTALDLLTRPEIITQAKDYFATVQQKNQQYVPGISATDMPQIQMNKETMDKFRPEQRKFYYDEARYDTYLDQLGIKFPAITKP
jgi:aminobenzoyl-glutamate utilization protein B